MIQGASQSILAHSKMGWWFLRICTVFSIDHCEPWWTVNGYSTVVFLASLTFINHILTTNYWWWSSFDHITTTISSFFNMFSHWFNHFPLSSFHHAAAIFLWDLRPWDRWINTQPVQLSQGLCQRGRVFVFENSGTPGPWKPLEGAGTNRRAGEKQ